MRIAVYNYIKNLKLKGRTLEIGSLNVNGEIKSALLEPENYIGMDMRAGPNVDIVANGHHIPFVDETFDNVLCLDTLEHDDKFWLTIEEMKRVCKIEGMILVIVPGIGFELHEHPSDYWRFTGYSMQALLGDLKNLEITDKDQLVMGKGIK
jgi:SAM-dependent methyltransferase